MQIFQIPKFLIKREYPLSKLLVGSWWVCAFAIVVFAIYEQANSRLEGEILALSREEKRLEYEIIQEKKLKSELILQVCSQSDPAWIELVLIKDLGLVPEGYTKIYFEEQN